MQVDSSQIRRVTCERRLLVGFCFRKQKSNLSIPHGKDTVSVNELKAFTAPQQEPSKQALLSTIADRFYLGETCPFDSPSLCHPRKDNG